MSDMPINEQECQQDAMQRLHAWLSTLEQRIHALLDTNDLETMTPSQREQAASRYLLLILRLLQMRQRCAEAAPSPAERALLDALFPNNDDQ